jgi:hypothetical protein
VLKSRQVIGGCFVAFLLLMGLLSFLGFFHPRTTEVGPSLKPYTAIEHPAMAEISGLVESAESPEVLWAHNDSGNKPRLFAITPWGDVIVPQAAQKQGQVGQAPGEGESYFEGIVLEDSQLVDWEDMARCGDDLYITEMGNNLNASRHLGVYHFKEPDPKQAMTLKAERFVEVSYPDQTGFPPTDRWHFDCEAAFCFDNNLYFVTKNRPAFRMFVQQGSASLYKLDLSDLKPENVLEKVDTVSGLEGWVTAADMSDDERWLAIVCESPVQSIWMFERPAQGDRFFSQAQSVKRFVFHDGGQLEALAFAHVDGKEVLLMINEAREMFQVDLSSFQPVSESELQNDLTP